MFQPDHACRSLCNFRHFAQNSGGRRGCVGENQTKSEDFEKKEGRRGKGRLLPSQSVHAVKSIKSRMSIFPSVLKTEKPFFIRKPLLHCVLSEKIA